MIEKWKDIKDFEGKYQVSNTGKIKSLKYLNMNKECIMKPRVNKRGHYSVNLYKNNKAYNFEVALLVARHFLKNENSDYVVVHIEDELDDNIKNLKYVSRSEARRIKNKKSGKQIKETVVENFDTEEYRNWLNIAKQNGITPHQFYKRLYEGWNVNEAITIPIKRDEHILKKRLYKYNGKLMSVNQLSKISGISNLNIYKRLSRGWTIEESVEIPLNRRIK